MLKTILWTLAVGAAGGVVASMIGLPSPWLLGAMLSVLATHVLRLPVHMPGKTTSLIALFMGVSIASSIELDFFDHLVEWRLAVLLLCVMLALLLGLLYLFYHRRCGWSRSDALLCSVPGNLAVVLIFASEAGLDPKRIALVHSVRLFFLVSALPLLFPIVDRPETDMTADVAYLDLLIVFLLAAIAGWGASRLKVPAGILIGGMLAALVMKLGFGFELSIPPDWFRVVLVVLGTAIAVRMTKLDLALLKKTLKGATGGLALSLLICGAFSALLHFGFDVPLLQAVLAYMPGGLEVMIAIAFSTDVDPLFVATHQLLRVLIMCFALPVLFGLMNRQSPSA